MHQKSSTVEPSISDVEKWLAITSGGLLLLLGAPLFYRGLTGRWPSFLMAGRSNDDTKVALAGSRGTNVREMIRINRPAAEVFMFWRRLANLPRFMSHLVAVTEEAPGLSHWVARGPAGVRVEWDAEIINEIDNELIAWRSLPGSDVVTAGSVNFEVIDGGGTRVSVNLQYSPPAGHAGDFVASLLGRSPAKIIRADLQRFKQLLETGEPAQTAW